MGLPVVTVAAGGLPVVETTLGTPVTEATNGYGVPVTKVIGKPGLPVRFDTMMVPWQGARMSRSTNLTPGTGDQIISFTTEDIDTGGLINIGSDATKIIIPSGAGWQAVRINGHARLTASFTPLYIQFKLNGGFITAAQGGGDVGATAESLSICSHYVVVTGGDFIQLNVFTVGAKTLSSAYLGVERLA